MIMNGQHRYNNLISSRFPTVLEIYGMLPEGMGCEVIFNELSMSPSPSKEHQILLIRLTAALYEFLNNNPLGTLLATPFDVYFEDLQSVVQPGLFIVEKKDEHIIKRNGVYGVPSIIIEIISTNRSYDTQRKRVLYEKAGVKEYFMIDPDNKVTVLLTLNSSGNYDQTYEEMGLLQSNILNFNIRF